MARLFILRHGQASYGAADYDQLSALGKRQSEQLGEHWARVGQEFDAVYMGPAKRHRQTFAGLQRGRRAAQVTNYPDPQCLPEFDEFPAFPIYDLHKEREPSFEKICADWMEASIDCGDIETARQFESRVVGGLEHIENSHDRGQKILLVTSGGPTIIAMKQALRLGTKTATELLWVVANASFSEFRLRDNQLSLVAFNQLPHISGECITYR